MKNISHQTAAVRAVCSLAFIICAILSVCVHMSPAIGVEEAFAGGTIGQAEEPEDTQPPADEPTEAASDKPTEPDEPTAPTLPEDGCAIVSADLSVTSAAFEFKNETKYTFDPQAIVSAGYPIPAVKPDEPTVLIIHTHATECYTAQDAQTVTETRSADPQKNMVAVGDVIVDTLKANGVNALHCTTMFDKDDYNSAYENSRKAVEEYLAKHPSLRYVIDVHRDAIQYDNGSMVKTSAEIDGESAAQVMLVVGTNQAGADHPGWKTNLCVAMRTQLALGQAHDNWARPINLRTASFNQQYAPGAFLLEIGTCANTLNEAKLSAKAFAEAFAGLITDP